MSFHIKVIHEQILHVFVVLLFPCFYLRFGLIELHHFIEVYEITLCSAFFTKTVQNFLIRFDSSVCVITVTLLSICIRATLFF